MKWLVQLVVLSLLVAAGTWFGGWWMVAVVGAAYGAWGARQRVTVVTAMLGGLLGWGALLAWDASVGPVDRLMEIFRALFFPFGGMLVVLTLAYAALLCAAAAALARGLRRLASPV